MPVPYTRLQIRLHWIIFALIVVQYLFHEPIAMAWRQIARGEEMTFSLLIPLHVGAGLVVLALVIWRLVLRVRVGAPPLPEKEPALMKLAAHGTHFALYALMVGMPVSGALAWFGGVNAAAEAHEVMRFFMLALVALHVVAALYHQFVLKTNLMARMKRPGTSG